MGLHLKCWSGWGRKRVDDATYHFTEAESPGLSDHSSEREKSHESLDRRVELGLEEDTRPSSLGEEGEDLGVMHSLANVMAEKHLKLSVQEIECLRLIFTKPMWWTRVWCVQEFALAQAITFICGSFTFPWDPSQFKSWTHSNYNSVSEQFIVSIFQPLILLEIIRNEVRKTNDPTDLGKFGGLLYHLRTHLKSCKDPRDRAFAVLSLSKFAQDIVKPDYKRSIYQVCYDVARCIILEMGSLDVLCCYKDRTIHNPCFVTLAQAAWTIGQIRDEQLGQDSEQIQQGQTMTLRGPAMTL